MVLKKNAIYTPDSQKNNEVLEEDLQQQKKTNYDHKEKKKQKFSGHISRRQKLGHGIWQSLENSKENKSEGD